MRAVELEGRVVAAIEARRNANVSPEDDFVECKGRWPEKDKARQLAGLANRAAGEPVMLIVGFDDRSGAVVDPGPTDPADWWQGMVGQFDQTPLDLLRHMRVHVGANEHVHAFAFGTDRVPFVVKNGQGRDVPMRDGTSTRSAYRHELLRLLLPTISTPNAIILSANVSLNRDVDTNGRENIHWWGSLRLFVEHSGPHPVMLPSHSMRGEISCEGTTVLVAYTSSPPMAFGATQRAAPRPISPYGAEARHDGVVLTGSASFELGVRGQVDREDYEALNRGGNVELTARLPVAGSSRPVILTELLFKNAPRGSQASDKEQKSIPYSFVRSEYEDDD